MGENIRIRSDIRSDKDLYARILNIIQAKSVTPFPLVYVAWYEEADNEIFSMHTEHELSNRELVMTEQKDWQYVEAVRGKINVLT